MYPGQNTHVYVKGKKLALKVVTVVTRLISLAFFCHHLGGKVVTNPRW